MGSVHPAVVASDPPESLVRSPRAVYPQGIPMALHLKQNLGVRMEQKLKLTPQMIQSIEILLLPQLALEERIMRG